jgi:hypothetical protein
MALPFPDYIELDSLVHCPPEGIRSVLYLDPSSERGRGFSDKNLRHMVQFPDHGIVSSLSRQLGWTHFRFLLYIDDPLKGFDR